MTLSSQELKIKRFMVMLIIVGIILASSGLGLAIFTRIATHQGVTGIIVITGLIVGGLFLSVPAKLYLTLQLMRHSDEKLATERRLANPPERE
jgi:hypothetical protein